MGQPHTEAPPTGTTDILRYFLRHPEAADSLYGVARWRLLEEAVQRSVETTERALRWLVDHGFLLERPSHVAEPTFQLNPEKSAEAERFLRSADG